MSDGKKQPEKQFRIGLLQLSVWANEVEKDGKKSVIMNTLVQRSYQDKDDKWQNTDSININDALKVQRLYGMAYDWFVLEHLPSLKKKE